MRLRPRFSLASLFVAVTAICVWLAWNAGLIHERKAIIEMILSRHGVIDGKGNMLPDVTYHGAHQRNVDGLPTIWKLFGVKPIGEVWLPKDGFSFEEVRCIYDAF